MAPQRETWTDERLDDFRAETHREFTAVRREMREGFARVDARFEEVNRRFDDVDRRFDEVNRRFDEVNKRFDKIDRRFEAIDRRFENVSAEFVAVRLEMKDGFEKLHRTLVWMIVSLVVAIVANGFLH